MWHKIKYIVHNLKKRKHAKLVALTGKPKLYDNTKEIAKQLEQEGYYSQTGQDKWLAENIFKNKKLGIFVDIGAHDGITFSNTFFFEKVLQWTGIAVEPIAELYEKLRKNRSCITMNSCIFNKNGKVKFRLVSGLPHMLSGISKTHGKTHLKRINRELKASLGNANEIVLPCLTLNDLLKQNNLFHVDYLSIDVEGAEYSILKKVDFGQFHISVIGVENNYQDYRIPQLLRKAGFHIHSILGADEFYVNQSFS